MSALTIYLLLTLTNLKAMAGVCVIFASTGVLGFVLAIGYFKDMGDPVPLGIYKGLRYSFTLLIVLATLGVFIPSKEDLAIIFSGAYISNNEEMSKLPDNAAKALNKFLEEYNEERVTKND